MNLEEETKFILKKYGIKANKDLGQNFLIDENIVYNIVESANICEEDLVIEIGPGLGTLTSELLKNAGKVVAVELDTKMIKILKDRFCLYNNFELINEDILKVDLKALIEDNLNQETTMKQAKIVANLPYYITTPIIMKLLEEELNIETITVMIQKEVADRLTAIPGKKFTGAITYTVYYYAEGKNIIKVPKESFMPEPSVDSEVIQLKIRKLDDLYVEDRQLLFKIIKYAFMQRRKTLVNALEKTDLFKNKQEITEILNKMGIDERIRGENLSLEQFTEISNKILNKK